MNYSGSILLSIFKRNVAEGVWTQLIDQSNHDNFKAFYNDYYEGEAPLIYVICSFEHWFLLTTSRIILSYQNEVQYIYYDSITQVRSLLLRGVQSGAKSVNDFTQIEVTDQQDKRVILILESGLPYWGVFYVLQFVCK